MRNLSITPVLNGFIVNTGCQVVVFEGKDKLLKELKRYIKNPTEVEKEYLKNRLFKPNDLENTPTCAVEGSRRTATEIAAGL